MLRKLIVCGIVAASSFLPILAHAAIEYSDGSVIADYHLNTDSVDASGNGHNGTDTGMNYGPGNGHIGGGAHFTNTYPNNNSSILSTTSNLSTFSVMFWVHSSSTANADNGMVTAGDWSTSGNLQMQINSNGANSGRVHYQPYGGTPDTETLSNATSIFDGAWHMIIITYKTSAIPTREIYFDGSIDISETFASIPTINFSSANMYIGTWKLGSNYRGFVNGDMDEVVLWNKILTSTEVTALWNSGTGQAVCTTVGCAAPTPDTSASSSIVVLPRKTSVFDGVTVLLVLSTIGLWSLHLQ